MEASSGPLADMNDAVTVDDPDDAANRTLQVDRPPPKSANKELYSERATRGNADCEQLLLRENTCGACRAARKKAPASQLAADCE